jgi:hypothetical protein
MIAKRKPPPRGPGGRPEGKESPIKLEALAKKRNHLIAATLRSALAGNADAIRVCFELIGDLPRHGRRITDTPSTPQTKKQKQAAPLLDDLAGGT